MTVQFDQHSLKTLHRSAMEHVDLADAARRMGQIELELEQLKKALELEQAAAHMLFFLIEVEPTRSVLYRSAASLAMRIGETRLAEQLIARGLGGQPPMEIAEELRDLYEQVSFDRHLSLRGLTLQPGEFQLSLSGPSVGAGVAPSDAAYERVMTMQKMLYRTAERKSGRTFRATGRPSTEIKDLYETYISVPRVASFAVTVRLGTKKDLFSTQEDVIQDVISNLSRVQKNDLDGLNEAIPDSPYFNNFIALAAELAPDGENISLVGLSTNTNKVALTQEKSHIVHEAAARIKRDQPQENHSEAIEIFGTIEFVDGRGQDDMVRLKTSEGSTWKVIVPQGLMDDVVAPNWRKRVRVSGHKAQQLSNTVLLETIVSAE